MSTLSARPPSSSPLRPQTIADLLARLGDIPPERVRLEPAIGTATERDVLEIAAREGVLCELVDGVLVEKAMSYRESLLALFIAEMLNAFVRPRNLGLVTGEAGMMRLFGGLIRIPDVAFASWDRIPGGKVPTEPVPALVPELAIEILSPGNTPAEMRRKRTEYFSAGVRLVWIVDPDSRSVSVYTGVEQSTVLHESDVLEGGEVLPGFSLPLKELFAELERRRNQ